MHMGAGRKPGRSNISDQLALADFYARLDAAREGRHMAVSGLITVTVLEADVFAVAGFPARSLDGAVAGGIDRRTHRGCPIHSGMHLGVTEDWMPTRTEAGSHHSIVHWLADQELFRALPGLVVVIDNAVGR